MKNHHKFFHSHETIRHFNRIFEAIQVSIFLLKDQNVRGITLNESLENLKRWITENCDFALATYPKIVAFINGHEAVDLTQYSDRAQSAILGDRINTDNFSNGLKTAISASNITNKTRLGNITVTHPLVIASLPAIFPSMKYLGILNDLLDASSYVLRGINPEDGTALVTTDEEKKRKVRTYLLQYDNFWNHPWPFEFESEVNLMTTAKNYVLNNLDSMSLIDLANYIDVSIEKLPLIRRVWSLG